MVSTPSAPAAAATRTAAPTLPRWRGSSSSTTGPRPAASRAAGSTAGRRATATTRVAGVRGASAASTTGDTTCARSRKAAGEIGRERGGQALERVRVARRHQAQVGAEAQRVLDARGSPRAPPRPASRAPRGRGPRARRAPSAAWRRLRRARPPRADRGGRRYAARSRIQSASAAGRPGAAAARASSVSSSRIARETSATVTSCAGPLERPRSRRPRRARPAPRCAGRRPVAPPAAKRLTMRGSPKRTPSLAHGQARLGDLQLDGADPPALADAGAGDVDARHGQVLAEHARGERRARAPRPTRRCPRPRRRRPPCPGRRGRGGRPAGRRRPPRPRRGRGRRPAPCRWRS